VVKKGNSTRTLETRDNLWYILDKEDFPADNALVEGAIKKIQGIKKINLVSGIKTNTLVRGRRGNGSRGHFPGSRGKRTRPPFIGKLGPDFFGCYVRRSDSDDVYLYDDFLRIDFDRPVNNWREKTVCAFNPDEATTLTISKPEQNELIALAKDTQGNWQIEEPVSGLAENSLVKNILTSLGTLKAADFAGEKELEASGIDNPALQFTVRLKDNRKKVLRSAMRKDKITTMRKVTKKNISSFWS
jgi:hypothetical protein